MVEKSKLGINILHPGTGTGGFDVVAIHGLNGHPEGTWTHKKSGTMWLKDLLPEAVPQARVMSFGFEASFKNITARQELRTTAGYLLTELNDCRVTEEEKSRPIVLICHCLGGIVAKKALVIGCTREQEGIQNAVRAVIFLGTPHRGSNLAKLGKVMASIVATCSPLKASQTILASIRKDYELLLEVAEDFVWRRKSMHVITFFETEMTHVTPFYKCVARIVDKRSAVLNLPNEEVIGQQSDHHEIVRFESLSDRNFRPLLSRLNEIWKLLRASLGTDGYTEAGSMISHQSEKGVKIPLELPISPCLVFLGREESLKGLKTHFNHDEPVEFERRKFALCGLGGSGKTQVAYHFVTEHAHQYKTGVMVFNAASESLITAEFSRIHELLKLEDAKDKVALVKRWLALAENASWLMLFDNADNLSSINLEKYFPQSRSGHILIVSRDQEAIGGIAEKGIILGPLRSEEAAMLLLRNAAINEPSNEDIDRARDIVKSLGFLPLAIDQAAAFIRSSHKGLRQYQQLYGKAQNDLLAFRPRFSTSEHTVLSAWELNFKQLEQNSTDAAQLLLLFSVLECSRIEEAMLYRGSQPQNRWNEEGEMIEVTADNEGLDESVALMLRDEIVFDKAIAKLRSYSLISCSSDANDLRVISIHPLVQHCALQRMPSAVIGYWMLQATLLVCHAFPRSRYVEPMNGDIGRAMLPQLNHVLNQYDSLEGNINSVIMSREKVASTVLAASRFLDLQWKQRCIERAEILIAEIPIQYLHALLAYRKSVVLRMSGRVKESENVLRKFTELNSSLESNLARVRCPQYNAHFGDIIISVSENLTVKWDLEEAKVRLLDWSPSDQESPSTLERITLIGRDITLGKILRYEGHFEAALLHLKRALDKGLEDDFFEGTGWYRVLISNMADVSCEVGHPKEAEQLLQQELQPLIIQGNENIATGQRMRLSLAEAFLTMQMYESSEEMLNRLYDLHRSTDKPDHATRNRLLRVLIGLARLYHYQACWDRALSVWEEALSTARSLDKDSDWDTGLIRYSIAYLLHRKGNKTEGHEMLLEAEKRLRSEKRIYWIARFNSAWHDVVLRQMNDECPTNCRNSSPGMESEALKSLNIGDLLAI